MNDISFKKVMIIQPRPGLECEEASHPPVS